MNVEDYFRASLNLNRKLPYNWKYPFNLTYYTSIHLDQGWSISDSEKSYENDVFCYSIKERNLGKTYKIIYQVNSKNDRINKSDLNAVNDDINAIFDSLHFTFSFNSAIQENTKNNFFSTLAPNWLAYILIVLLLGIVFVKVIRKR